MLCSSLPSVRRLAAALGLAVVVGFPVAACNGSTTGSDAPPPTSTADGAPATFQSRYATVADLAAALRVGGIDCQLEYEGLRDDASNRELSICVIQGEQAYLYVWSDEADLAEFVAGEGAGQPVAVGGNWSITVSTPETAAAVAANLGGRVP